MPIQIKKASYADLLYFGANDGTCTVCYYDGHEAITARADVHGSVVPPRGENGFGFDSVFVRDGQSKTSAEMTPAEKDATSHRAKAIEELVNQLRKKID